MKSCLSSTSYYSFISPELNEFVIKHSQPVEGIEELRQIGEMSGLETPESLKFMTEIYLQAEPLLERILQQRVEDREFLDARVRSCSQFNKNLSIDFNSPNYKTPIGLEDSQGRVVFGPLNKSFAQPCNTDEISPGKLQSDSTVEAVPDFLTGPHVTLFGPPDSKKLSINAMNALHRKIQGEPEIVAQLIGQQDSVPKWGADDEDSKTPLRQDLVDAGINLTDCLKGVIEIPGDDKYRLTTKGRSLPIKRFPGLALPSTFLFYMGKPIPLHIYDFALHIFANWDNPKALVFYIPKIENEEEATYFKQLIELTEQMVKGLHPSYQLGSIRTMIVLENPRAILRVHEIIDALHPYFVGASLGWHDYLASTARIFKEDSNYRIPVKADPDIVVKYIKASHNLLAAVVGSRGGITVGGMYGVLPMSDDLQTDSFQITMRGYFIDVITQLKRGLSGFWVAHPDFVRIGLALVEAYRQYKDGDSNSIEELVRKLLRKPYGEQVLEMLHGEDVEGLSIDSPNYIRSLLAADIKQSDFIANNDPEEIRYNVFQSLQYLADWLCGNGCVALPANIEGTQIRVMDDLATAERSRWEVWHELHHGRFELADFIQIAYEELSFIRNDLSDDKKTVQVKWNETTSKWYPIAFRIMLKLMTDKSPVEFATELLLPFTIPQVRQSETPLSYLENITPEKYELETPIKKLNYYFEICGNTQFAEKMAELPCHSENLAKQSILGFAESQIIQAASFHGDIGQSKKNLDALAKEEQAGVDEEEKRVSAELIQLGNEYREKFGIKFLVSAKGKSGQEMLQLLKVRMANSKEEELNNARHALWEISQKRFRQHPIDLLDQTLKSLTESLGITGASVSLQLDGHIQSLSYGETKKDGTLISESTQFQMASLSKTIAAVFAADFFRSQGIPLSHNVNTLLGDKSAKYCIPGDNSEWVKQLEIKHLINHTALNMHYVKGISAKEKFPEILQLINGSELFDYPKCQIINSPGTHFSYSGAGFMILQLLIETIAEKPIEKLLLSWLENLGLDKNEFGFHGTEWAEDTLASGHLDDKTPIERLNFPLLAAGITSTSRVMAQFLEKLGTAFSSLESQDIAHEVAAEVLFGEDFGSSEFIGAKAGLGTFILEAGTNKWLLHQGANDGYRSLYMHCFSGDDKGKGFVIYCNADNQGMLFCARSAQLLLNHLAVKDVCFKRFDSEFDFAHLPQEQIVNLGYKNLVFDAFSKELPEPISRSSSPDSLLKNSQCIGAEILHVTDQKFALAENLFSPCLPTYDPCAFGQQGKVMDSWESARHTQGDYDELIVKLANPSRISYIYFSTTFHEGNNAEKIEIDAKTNEQDHWKTLLQQAHLTGHSVYKVKLESPLENANFIRVRIFPDGGLSRLATFDQVPPSEKEEFKQIPSVKRYPEEIPQPVKPMVIPYRPTESEITNHLANAGEPIDYACSAFGGRIEKVSNEHFGVADQVIAPFSPLNMFDGFESARSRIKGNYEFFDVALGKSISISRIIVDFTFFKNNNPKSMEIWAFNNNEWHRILEQTSVKQYAGNRVQFRFSDLVPTEKVQVRVFPDGGINRIHIYQQ